MGEKNNATCSICGSPYYMCLSCKDMMNLHPWKRYTDTSEHYKIYQILRGYNTNVYSKDEARLKLQMVDLSDFDSLRDNIKNIINDIMEKKENVADLAIESENKYLSNDSFTIFKNSSLLIIVGRPCTSCSFLFNFSS